MNKKIDRVLPSFLSKIDAALGVRSSILYCPPFAGRARAGGRGEDLSRRTAVAFRAVEAVFVFHQSPVLARAGVLFRIVCGGYARVQIAAGTPEAAIKEDRARSQGMKLIKEAYEKGGDEAVEKLFGGDMLMTVLNNNRTDLHDMVSHYVTVTKAGSGKTRQANEDISTNLKRHPIGGAE